MGLATTGATIWLHQLPPAKVRNGTAHATRRTVFAGGNDDYYWYFYPDLPNHNSDATRVPLFSEVDNIGVVPGKLKAIATAQRMFENGGHFTTCFRRPLAQKRLKNGGPMTYPNFRQVLAAGFEKAEASQFVRWLLPSRSTTSEKVDLDRAIGARFNQGSLETPEWIFCLWDKTYADGVKTSDLIRKDTPGLWVL
mmetsp:Transcript_18770/g.46944  ORF Transcript_18770/g.46944 Transcript_18770/m.46944 type:complete len:195 (+) Transcript_18770:105-689(+)|eukprot:g8074.t1